MFAAAAISTVRPVADCFAIPALPPLARRTVRGRTEVPAPAQQRKHRGLPDLSCRGD
jgi:hypothetical protein